MRSIIFVMAICLTNKFVRWQLLLYYKWHFSKLHIAYYHMYMIISLRQFWSHHFWCSYCPLWSRIFPHLLFQFSIRFIFLKIWKNVGWKYPTPNVIFHCNYVCLLLLHLNGGPVRILLSMIFFKYFFLQ